MKNEIVNAEICNSDCASLKLMSRKNGNVFLETGSDGYTRYLIVNNGKEIPADHKRLPFHLSGKWKIMYNDCSKKYSDYGREIESIFIEFYQNGNSFIIRLHEANEEWETWFYRKNNAMID